MITQIAISRLGFVYTLNDDGAIHHQDQHGNWVKVKDSSPHNYTDPIKKWLSYHNGNTFKLTIAMITGMIDCECVRINGDGYELFERHGDGRRSLVIINPPNVLTVKGTPL